MKINWTYADKAIVSVLSNVVVYLNTPNMTWREGTALAIGSLLVWLVPNTGNANPPTVAPTNNATLPILPNERQELEMLRAQQKSG